VLVVALLTGYTRHRAKIRGDSQQKIKKKLPPDQVLGKEILGRYFARPPERGCPSRSPADDPASPQAFGGSETLRVRHPRAAGSGDRRRSAGHQSRWV